MLTNIQSLNVLNIDQNNILKIKTFEQLKLLAQNNQRITFKDFERIFNSFSKKEIKKFRVYIDDVLSEKSTISGKEKCLNFFRSFLESGDNLEEGWSYIHELLTTTQKYKCLTQERINEIEIHRQGQLRCKGLDKFLKVNFIQLRAR